MINPPTNLSLFALSRSRSSDIVKTLSYVRKKFYLTFLLSVFGWMAFCQSEPSESKIPTFTESQRLRQHGIIWEPRSAIPHGSAVILGPSNSVVTCWHVFKDALTAFNETNLFFCNSKQERFSLTPIFIETNLDIAVFQPSPPFTNADRFEIAELKSVSAKDSLFFFGFDSRQSYSNRINEVASFGVVTAIVTTTNNENSVSEPMIEFEGDAIRGYSGGAVFNAKNQVVGLTRASYYTQDGLRILATPVEVLKNFFATNSVKKDLGTPVQTNTTR